MKLTSAAKFFDKLSVKDAYNGLHSSYGQLDLYDDVARDGLTAVRRILSVAPGSSMPARGAVKLGDDVFLASARPAQDFFKADLIRSKYILQRSDGLAEIKTVLKELTNTSGVSAYAAKLWVKGAKEVDESSDITDVLTIYFAQGEAIEAGQVVSLGGSWYVLRDGYATASGFTAATADHLAAPNFETASYAARVYVPTTDSYTSAATNIKVLRLRWQAGFEYLSPASAKYDAGDDIVMVAVAEVPAPTTGDLITLSDGVRRVEGIQANGALWNLHVRRA